MNIQETIEKYCPDGVEYKPLYSITSWDKKFNGVEKTKQSQVIKYNVLLAKDLFALEQPEGNVFLLSTGEQVGWTTEDLAGNNICEGEVVTIPWGKSRKVVDCIKYYKGKFVTGDNRIATSSDTSVLNNKYLYYCMMSNGDTIDSFYRGAGIQHPDMASVLDMEIPVPPLPVQEEIVRILDKYLELEEELEVSLEAELDMRKKQYEYYRDKMLSLEDYEGEVEWVPLLSVAEIGTGNHNTQDAIEDGEYTFYVRSQTPLKLDSYDYDDESIVTAGDGVGVGKIFHITNGKYALHQRAYRIHLFSSQIDVKFLYYYFTARFYDYIAMAKYDGSVSSIRLPMLKDFKVPVIKDMNEQKRIVDVLDKFSTLTEDISEGLPAEIAMQHKRYEYYRDKLLNFKRLEVAQYV